MTVDVFRRLGIVFGRIPGRVSAEQTLWSFPHLVFKVQKKPKEKHWKRTNTFSMEYKINGLTPSRYHVERQFFKGRIAPQPSLIRRVRILSHSGGFCMNSVLLLHCLKAILHERKALARHFLSITTVSQTAADWLIYGSFCSFPYAVTSDSPVVFLMTNFDIFLKGCGGCSCNWSILGQRKWDQEA